MSDKHFFTKQNVIWMFIGGIFGAVLGIAAFYDSWLG